MRVQFLAFPATVIAALLAVQVPASAAEPQARILSKSGATLVISVGATSGVKSGLTGRVIGAELLLGTVQRREIGTFRVETVTPDTCTATLTSVKAGWLVKPDLEVVFDAALAAVDRVAPDSPAARTEAERLRMAANAAWERRDWPAAISAYKELIELSPGDQEAHVRLRQAQDRQDLANQRVVPAMPAEGLSRYRRESQAARQKDRELIPVYRETARELIDAGRWDEAVAPLRNLSLVDPQDSFLQASITRRREQAENAFAAHDYDGTVVACDTILAILDDPMATTLRQRALSARVETTIAPIIREAEEMTRELARLESASRAAQVGPELVPTMRRKVATLARLAQAQAEATGTAAKDHLVDLTRQVAAAGMIFAPATSFRMGCVEGDRECDVDERPARTVAVRPFFIEPHEVTIAQFRAFAVSTGHPKPPAPGFEQDDLHPVVNVSWHDADAYCAWIGGRLPVEAEWEFAARAGQPNSKYPGGGRISHDNANFEGTKGADVWERTAPLGSFPPNRIGLLDSIGNVWEWCHDWYRPDYVSPSTPGQDGTAPATGFRSLRGGSWLAGPRHLRLSERSWFPPGGRTFNIGFRCARSS